MYESKTRTVLEFYVSTFYAQPLIYRLLDCFTHAKSVKKFRQYARTKNRQWKSMSEDSGLLLKRYYKMYIRNV